MGHARRLEDKIRLLCAKAVAAKEHADVREIISDLQASLREHAQRVRRFALSALARPIASKPDRRKIAR
jgi:hypothetical protein